ncbi:MAG: class I SAM-dependent methyltransferase, partial [Acidiferrobacterales bacterium]
MAQWSKEQVEAGQAVYTPKTFAVHDLFVHGLSNQAVWRCPTRRLQALYDRNVAARHLDVGVGTGYFLDKARWPVERPAITLVDLNEHSLKAAADRIERFGPDSVRANVLEPLHDIGRFDSVGLCYLLHCLPGTLPPILAQAGAAAWRHVVEYFTAHIRNPNTRAAYSRAVISFFW